jgi:hypothetical protein
VCQTYELHGVVLDADSGQPIAKLHVALGQSFDPDRFYAGYRGTKDFSDANGEFTLSVDDEMQNGVKAGADNYADQIQTLVKDYDASVKMEFRLKPSATLDGTVIGPDGTPLPAYRWH